MQNFIALIGNWGRRARIWRQILHPKWLNSPNVAQTPSSAKQCASLLSRSVKRCSLLFILCYQNFTVFSCCICDCLIFCCPPMWCLPHVDLVFHLVLYSSPTPLFFWRPPYFLFAPSYIPPLILSAIFHVYIAVYVGIFDCTVVGTFISSKFCGEGRFSTCKTCGFHENLQDRLWHPKL